MTRNRLPRHFVPRNDDKVMTNDWKLILKVVLGSAILMMVVIFGLSRMAGSTTALKADMNVLLNWAKLIKENGETKVTVVNFSDMECPACKSAHEQLADLMTLPGVKVVFRHYPLSIHPNAVITARAVEAARQMGKGWEMVDLLYSKQDEWAADTSVETRLIGYANTLGLDGNIFKANLESATTSAAVQQDVDLGNSLQLTGTPTIFVNGEQIGAEFVVAKVKDLLKQ
jgi:protein-disulfide isomerase